MGHTETQFCFFSGMPGHIHAHQTKRQKHRTHQEGSAVWLIFTMPRHYCLTGKCDRFMGWAGILSLWEENQRKETKANPEDSVNSWSPLRKGSEVWPSQGTVCKQWQPDACIMKKASWPLWTASFCSRKKPDICAGRNWWKNVRPSEELRRMRVC